MARIKINLVAHTALGGATASTKHAEMDALLGLLPGSMVYGKGTQLMHYLLGEPVKDDWVKGMLKRVSSVQPKVLYRLSVVSTSAKVGTSINVPKKLVSASDQPLNAVFAGCSYHYNNDISIEGKQLALIEIQNPKCIVSHDELKAIVGKNMDEVTTSTKDEREYLIRGPVKGKVLQLVRNELVTKGKYLKVLGFIRKKDNPEKTKKMLASIEA